jgi:DNA-binding transcriptional regulator YhcF (GntR family)
MFTIDDVSGVPPYEQIRTQVVDHVARGTWQPGDRLPTVRRLAEELGVATNTVARAYRELEQGGVVETRGRAGTFVTGDQVEREAKEAAVAYLARTTALGLTSAEALALVRDLHEHPIRS